MSTWCYMYIMMYSAGRESNVLRLQSTLTPFELRWRCPGASSSPGTSNSLPTTEHAHQRLTHLYRKQKLQDNVQGRDTLATRNTKRR